MRFLKICYLKFRIWGWQRIYWRSPADQENVRPKLDVARWDLKQLTKE